MLQIRYVLAEDKEFWYRLDRHLPEQATSYLFGFGGAGIDFFPIQGDWDIADRLFLPWSDVTSFKMKNGLLENEMIVETSSTKIEMKINKAVVNNPWVKENVAHLKEKNYFYNK